MVLAQGRQRGQGLAGPAEGDIGGEPRTPGFQVSTFGAGRLARRLREIGQRGAAPQRQGVVQQRGGLDRIAVGQRPRPLVRQLLKTVQVDIGGDGTEPVPAVYRGDRLPADGPQTSAISSSAVRARPGRSASAVSSVRRRGPPMATGVPSLRWAWAVPRIP